MFSDYYCHFLFFVCVWVHFKVLVLCNNNWWMHAWAYKEISKWQHFLEGMRPSKPQESASSVCLFSLIICTVKVCSSNRHYLFSFFFFFLPTHSWDSKQCSFFFFLFVIFQPREPAAVPLAFGKRMSVQIGARRRRERTSRTMTSPACVSTEWVGAELAWRSVCPWKMCSGLSAI